ncbi:Glycosyl transferase family 10, partial [Trinorchestia longiramus]
MFLQAVFWCLCGLTSLLLVLESYGPENVLPYYDPDSVRRFRAPEIYFEFDDEPASSINSSELHYETYAGNKWQKYEDNVSISSFFPGITPEPFDRSKLKTILVWNNGYGSNSEGLPDGDEHELERVRCPQPNCVVMSREKKKLPDHLYDAIIFHFRATTLDDLPKSRADNQRWIFRESEPASYIFQYPHKYDGMFNWTYTYRNDSDVVMSPFRVIPKTPAELAQPPSALEMRPLPKPRMAAWFVSNCNAHSGRDRIVKQLQKFIDVDIYGKCGTLKCGRENEVACRRMLEENYKFYLAFENSLCKDYVTEKLFETLK